MNLKIEVFTSYFQIAQVLANADAHLIIVLVYPTIHIQDMYLE